MSQVVIENPVINPPFAEPKRHFKFTEDGRKLLPILRQYDTIGSTQYVDFDTARDVYRTRPTKSHISHVVLDSGWEAKVDGVGPLLRPEG